MRRPALGRRGQRACLSKGPQAGSGLQMFFKMPTSTLPDWFLVRDSIGEWLSLNDSVLRIMYHEIIHYKHLKFY